MDSLEVQRFDEEISMQAHSDDSLARISALSLLKRFYNWVLDETVPPADESFEDWADRQW